MAKKQRPPIIGRSLSPDEVARITRTGRYADIEPKNTLSKAQSTLLGSVLVGAPLPPEVRERLEAEIAAEKDATQQAKDEVIQLENVAPSDVMHPDIAGRLPAPTDTTADKSPQQ